MADSATDSEKTRQLLAQARLGDRRAFEQLFRRHGPYLRQVIELRLDPKLRQRVDVSDVVQETQIEAFRRLDDFLQRRPMPFRLWLRKTAYERLVNLREQHVEAARRAVGREVRFPDHSSLQLAQKLFARGPTPSAQLNQKELKIRVGQAVARLSEADREVLLMRVFEGLSYQEVGQMLDISPVSARKRYSRALLHQRQLSTFFSRQDHVLS